MIPASFMADVRDDLITVLTEEFPDDGDVILWRTAPDDVLDTPSVAIDLLTCSKGFEVPGSTVVRATVICVAHRTDTASAFAVLEDLTARVWTAFGAGQGVILPYTKAQMRAMSAQVSNQQVGDTTWPTVNIDSDVIVTSGYC